MLSRAIVPLSVVNASQRMVEESCERERYSDLAMEKCARRGMQGGGKHASILNVHLELSSGGRAQAKGLSGRLEALLHRTRKMRGDITAGAPARRVGCRLRSSKITSSHPRD